MGKQSEKKLEGQKNTQKLPVKKKVTGTKGSKRREIGIPGLIILLVLVLVGSVVFVGAASGWFDDKKVVIDGEYHCAGDCGETFVELGAEEYEKLVNEKKSFVVFVDQAGCKTAEHLKEYVDGWARENHMRVYRMMFSDMKETSLHDVVKFYPSVAVISKGKPVKWLRADEDEDAEAYNNTDAFKKWISEILR